MRRGGGGGRNRALLHGHPAEEAGSVRQRESELPAEAVGGADGLVGLERAALGVERKVGKGGHREPRQQRLRHTERGARPPPLSRAGGAQRRAGRGEKGEGRPRRRTRRAMWCCAACRASPCSTRSRTCAPRALCVSILRADIASARRTALPRSCTGLRYLALSCTSLAYYRARGPAEGGDDGGAGHHVAVDLGVELAAYALD